MDRDFFGISHTLDDHLSEGQKFPTKEHLQTELGKFLFEKNMEINVQNSSQSMYIVTCKVKSCRWRLYAKATDTGAWVIAKKKHQHSCFGSATRQDHRQMTARMIATLIKKDLRANLEMTVNQVCAAVKSKYAAIEPSYNKLWRGREIAIVDLFGRAPVLVSGLHLSTRAVINEASIGQSFTRAI
jgi:hypothetical protein